MGYSFPNYIYPTGSDVSAAATFLAQRQSPVPYTNGGITGTAGFTGLAQLGQDTNGIGSSYFKAMMDALMCTMGLQAIDTQLASNANSSSTSFTDAGGYATYSFTAPIAKNYLIGVDVSNFVSSGAPCVVYWQLLVNGTVVGSANTHMHFAAINIRQSIHFERVCSMAAGANVLKLQWKLGSAGTMNTSTDDMRTFRISG